MSLETQWAASSTDSVVYFVPSCCQCALVWVHVLLRGCELSCFLFFLTASVQFS